MKVLLLSAYHAASHAYWCDGLMAACPDIDWTLKTQPARHFSWRVRANGWLWALADDPAFKQGYDLIIATSLVDMAAIKARCPALRDVPLWVYCHENQFAYPLSDRQRSAHQTDWQFQNIVNLVSADWVSFNTHFNRDTFFKGARQLLKRFPETLPGEPLAELERRSDVLPVPLTDTLEPLRQQPKESDLIVWNHRWEWDKQPERFLKALVRLQQQGTPFRLAMLGAGGGRSVEFDDWRTELGDRVVQWGEVSRADYRDWLSHAGIGVSTALHDFQGLSMLELAQVGATVVVPNRLAYPECLPGASFYPGSETDEDRDVDDLVTVLAALLDGHSEPASVRGRLPLWRYLADSYRETMRFLASMQPVPSSERSKPLR